MEKKKILFITAAFEGYWQFMNEIEKLKEEGHICHLVEALAEAKKITDAKVDLVVMYPFSIDSLGYDIPTDRNGTYAAGWSFWEQELKEKNIPTIIVDFGIFGPEMINYLKETNLGKDPNVKFFSYDVDGGRSVEDKLLTMIRA